MATLLSVAALAACDTAPPPWADARRQWQEQGPSSYSYHWSQGGYVLLCFGAVELDVEVQDANGTRCVDEQGSESLGYSECAMLTMDHWFDVVADATCDTTRLEFDAEYGFPLEFYEDCGEEGGGFAITGFQVL